MRELILGMSVSLDGFVSGPDGEAKWIFSGDPEAIAWKVQNAWNASLHIMGSRTFQSMATFWPTTTGGVRAADEIRSPKRSFQSRDRRS